MESARRTRPSGPWSGSRPYLGFLYVGGPCGPLPVTNRADGPCSHRKPEGGGMGTLFSISPTSTYSGQHLPDEQYLPRVNSTYLGATLARDLSPPKTTRYHVQSY